MKIDYCNFYVEIVNTKLFYYYYFFFFFLLFIFLVYFLAYLLIITIMMHGETNNNNDDDNKLTKTLLHHHQEQASWSVVTTIFRGFIEYVSTHRASSSRPIERHTAGVRSDAMSTSHPRRLVVHSILGSRSEWGSLKTPGRRRN